MYKLQVNTDRKSEISEEELPDDEQDFNYFDEEDIHEDDESEEREYCD